MAETTRIEWADATFNMVIGCSHVSPGCDNCYAEAMAHRRGWHDWSTGPRKTLSDAYWRQPLVWNRKAQAEGRPWRVFCSSLADVFDPLNPPEERHRLFELIQRTPWLVWMLLTKRPQQIQRFLPSDWSVERYPNVWLGITAEDQKHYDRRWPVLSGIDATVRFVSYEPALGPLNIGVHTREHGDPDWLIWGGESGPRARRPDHRWIRHITALCQQHGIAVFGKQWGTYLANPLSYAVSLDTVKEHDPPENGKGGALLDGVLHREIPEVPLPCVLDELFAISS